MDATGNYAAMIVGGCYANVFVNVYYFEADVLDGGGLGVES